MALFWAGLKIALIYDSNSDIKIHFIIIDHALLYLYNFKTDFCITVSIEHIFLISKLGL